MEQFKEKVGKKCPALTESQQEQLEKYNVKEHKNLYEYVTLCFPSSSSILFFTLILDVISLNNEVPLYPGSIYSSP